MGIDSFPGLTTFCIKVFEEISLFLSTPSSSTMIRIQGSIGSTVSAAKQWWALPSGPTGKAITNVIHLFFSTCSYLFDNLSKMIMEGSLVT